MKARDSRAKNIVFDMHSTVMNSAGISIYKMACVSKLTSWLHPNRNTYRPTSSWAVTQNTIVQDEDFDLFQHPNYFFNSFFNFLIFYFFCFFFSLCSRSTGVDSRGRIAYPKLYLSKPTHFDLLPRTVFFFPQNEIQSPSSIWDLAGGGEFRCPIVSPTLRGGGSSMYVSMFLCSCMWVKVRGAS